MTVPGVNLLIQALQMMGTHDVLYYKNTGRERLPNGTYDAQFAPGVTIDTGQIQPVPRDRYLQLGYDANKDYVTWYVPQLDVQEVKRGESGDEFVYNGTRYKCVNNNDWFAQDGWIGIVGVKIGSA